MSGDYKGELERLAAKVLESLTRPGGARGRTAWELKMELKVPHTSVFAALGILLERKAVDLTPQELTVLVTPAGATVPKVPSESVA
ncbi:MAG: hypothetical protein HYZ75_01915 [Elusimicrobia bacterium]|nr:hypothetical protein [Elusimicrobiota bacterium]